MESPFPIPPHKNAAREEWADYYEECIIKGAPKIHTPRGVCRVREEGLSIAAYIVSFVIIGCLLTLILIGCGFFTHK